MTKDELKKKIVKVLKETINWTTDYSIPIGIVYKSELDKIADALIAAGIGDVSKWKVYAKVHRIVITKDDKIKQLYSDEEVDKIVNQRAEYKHRAEVAERALENACVVILSSRNGDQPRRLRAYYKAYLEAAEKELAEENNGKKEV